MTIYQCLFFKDGRVTYWENIAARSEDCLRGVLAERLRGGGWDLAEAWLDDALSVRFEAAPPPM